MDFDKLFSHVLNTDSGIRYVAIQDNTGKIITGGFRENVTPILNDEDIQMMHHYASQRWQTRKNIEHKLGSAKYAMAEYDEIKRISFPIDEKHLLMVTAELSLDHTNVIAQVLELINHSK